MNSDNNVNSERNIKYNVFRLNGDKVELKGRKKNECASSNERISTIMGNHISFSVHLTYKTCSVLSCILSLDPPPHSPSLAFSHFILICVCLCRTRFSHFNSFVLLIRLRKWANSHLTVRRERNKEAINSNANRMASACAECSTFSTEKNNNNKKLFESRGKRKSREIREAQNVYDLFHKPVKRYACHF